ncbi:Uncharacterised protein [uncultured archaeon]|nr:Uncharacterised protein [uncultured archaeon]
MRTLERRDEKIRKLTSSLQEANLAVKAAEKRASATLPPARPAPEEKRPQASRLGPREMNMLLKRLKACRSPEEDLLFACFIDEVPKLEGLPDDAMTLAQAARSRRGVIILRAPQLFCMLLVPPFPVHESLFQESGSFKLDSFVEMMETPVLVLSLHAGDSFLGVALSHAGFEVAEHVESPVKEKHSKGGWSQKRFERLREEDIKSHVDAVLQVLALMKSKYGPLVKYAVLGGDDGLIKQIAPSVGLPVVLRHLEKEPEKLLDEVYSFTCYRT